MHNKRAIKNKKVLTFRDIYTVALFLCEKNMDYPLQKKYNFTPNN